MKIEWRSLIVGLVLGSIISCGIIMQMRPKQQFFYVNIEDTIAQVIKKVQEENLPTEEERKKRIQEVKERFKQKLDEYAKHNNAVIFSLPKPIAGIKDRTEEMLKISGIK